MMAGAPLSFENSTIGRLLRQGRLEVPPNQRSYAWRSKHVRNLLQDFNEALLDAEATSEYFLGAIVLIQEPGKIPSIVDGQQRIATIAILLARVRDYLNSLGRDGSARAI